MEKQAGQYLGGGCENGPRGTVDERSSAGSQPPKNRPSSTLLEMSATEHSWCGLAVEPFTILTRFIYGIPAGHVGRGKGTAHCTTRSGFKRLVGFTTHSSASMSKKTRSISLWVLFVFSATVRMNVLASESGRPTLTMKTRGSNGQRPAEGLRPHWLLSRALCSPRL